MKKNKRLFVLVGIISILAMGLIGCNLAVSTNSDSINEKNFGTITGKVVYSNSVDNSDIWVSIEKSDGLITESVERVVELTDRLGIENARSVVRSVLSRKQVSANGAYNFTNLEPGIYTVYASSNISKERAVTTNVTVEANSTVTATDLKLTATGSICGKVSLDGDGKPGFIVNLAGTSFLAVTSEDGAFTISDVPAGTEYNLSIMFGTYTYLVTEKVKSEAGKSKNVATINLTTDEIKNKLLISDGKDGVDGKDGENGKDGISIIWRGSFSSSNEIKDPVELNAYYNTKDGCTYIYVDGEWVLLASAGKNGTNGKDGENGKDGISIIWRGSFASSNEIKDPVELNAYYNTKDGCAYIYVDGEWVLLASAGKNGADGKDGDGGNCYKYVYAWATDRGIKFAGTIPSNVTISDSQNGSSTVKANCTISITDVDNDIVMQKGVWSLNSGDWNNWNMIYPLVEEGKAYTFRVRVWWRDYTFYEETVSITATGGLGEYKIENVDKLDVELTDDKVIRRIGEPEFTQNDNVIIKRYGITYCLYALKDIPKYGESMYNGTWVLDGTVFGDYNTYPVNDLYYLRGWGEKNPEMMLSGHKYGVSTATRLEIAGYTDDDNIFFEMNDRKESYGDWGGNKLNILVVYGWEYPEDNLSSATDFVIKRKDKDEKEIEWAEVMGLPGTKHDKYPYSEVYDILDTRFEPVTLPKIHITDEENLNEGITDDNFRFEKWSVVYPVFAGNWSYSGKLEDNIVNVDGKKCLVQYVYAQFTPVMSYTVKFMMNDGTDTVYTTKKLSTEKQNDATDWPNWNGLYYIIEDLADPEREGYTFTGWYEDKDCSKKQDNYAKILKDTEIYAGWAKNVTVKFMDGSTELDTVKVYEGYSVDSIAKPEKTDYILEGWYSDSELTEKVKVITTATTVLYAKWIKPDIWWTGNSSYSVYPSISSDKLNSLSVGDTLYFEIYTTSSLSNASGNVAFRDQNTNITKNLNYSIQRGEKELLSYTFGENDSLFISYLRNNGLGFNTYSSSLYLTAIYYIKADSN